MGERPYTTGITQFSDLTHQEFKDNFLGLKRFPGQGQKMAPTRNFTAKANLPDEINWVEKGAVTDVKNQGMCGSCWAFAVTEQVESYLAINTGDLMDLSAQQVTSCSPNALQCGGTGGCAGSVTQLGFNYLNLFGMMSDADYPYVSGQTSDAEECVYDPSKTQVTLTGYTACPPTIMMPSCSILPRSDRCPLLWTPASGTPTPAACSTAAPSTRTSPSTTGSNSLDTVQTLAHWACMTTGW